MKKTNILVFLFIVMMSVGLFAQATHTVDFETADTGQGWDWTAFEYAPGVTEMANPVSGGINTSATVMEFVAHSTDAMWTGCWTQDDGEFTFDVSNSTVTIMVYKDTMSTVKMRFEGPSAPIELDAINTVTGAWEMLSYDFSAAIGNTYNKVIIFPDFQDRGLDHTIYFDNITVPDGVIAEPDPEPTDTPPVPTHAEEDVIPIYTEVYTDLTGTDFNPNWGQSTTVTVDYLVAGNNTLKYGYLNYQGTQYTNQDVSAYHYLHVDFWTYDSTTLDFYLISPGNETNYTLPITTEQWVSVDIPLADYVPPVVLTDVFQFKVVGDGTVFFDNWYFWKDPNALSSDATLSDLLVDGTTVDGFSPTVYSYDVELPEGTTIVPTVTATTNDVNASYVVSDADSIPGTTEVVVTAEDEVTELTYSIDFSIEGVVPESEYCETETWHFNNPAETASAIYLTITNLDTLTLFIEIESANADPVDYLLVNNSSGGTSSAENTSVPGKISRTLSWSSNPPDDVDLNILWSKESFGGNWQLSPTNITVPFDAECETGGPSSDARLSDLLVDGTTVDGFSPTVYSYDVELPEGTTIVPTVTATTYDENASYIVSDAESIPGTTEVVVTAEDEVTELTYSVNFSIEGVVPESEYCETETWHFNNPAETASAIYLTVTNLDALTMFIEIESADADPVDLLLLYNSSGGTASDENTSVPGKISRTLSWTSSPPDLVSLQILWSKVSTGGNWMLDYFTVPFEASCDSGTLEAPTNVMISIASTEVTITWNAVDGASSYIVYSCDTPDGTFEIDTTGTFDGTSWSDSIVGEGSKYYYVVASTDRAE